MTEDKGGEIRPEKIKVNNIYDNTTQDIIRITVDRLRSCLRDHVDHLNDKRGWIAPLGILITIVLTLSTADFKQVYVSAATWRAVFIISTGLVTGWLIYAIWLAFARRNKGVEDIIEELKNSDR